MADTAIDFEQAAREFGGTISTEPPKQETPKVDWDSVAKEFGGSVSSTAPKASAPAKLDWSKVATEFGGTVSTEPPKDQVQYDLGPIPANNPKIGPGPEPGFWERVKASIIGSPRSGDRPIGRALGYSFEAPSDKHVNTADLPSVGLSELAPEITQIAGAAIPGIGPILAQTQVGQGVGKGLAQVAESMTTAPNLLMAAGSEGFELLAQVNKLLPRAVSGAFIVNMLHQAYDQIPAFRTAWDSNNPEEIAKAITEMAATLGMGVAAGTHATVGAGRDIAAGIEAHNVEAARLVEQERTQPTPITEAPEFVLGAEKIPVSLNGEMFEIRPAGMSGQRRPYYDVVNQETGEVQFAGYGASVQDWLRSRGATPDPSQAPPLPEAPTVEQTSRRPRREAPTPPPIPTAPEGWSFADEKPAETVPSEQPTGTSFQRGKDKFTIQKVENGKVTFDFEGPTGAYTESFPKAIFDKMVATSQVQPGQAENKEVAPAPQKGGGPAEQPSEQPEAAGAGEGPNVQGEDRGAEQPGEVRPSEGVASGEVNLPGVEQPEPVRGLQSEGAREPSGVESQPTAGSEGRGGEQVEKSTVDEEKPSYSSTHVNLPPEYGKYFKAATEGIADKDLAEDGRETDPHITIKYGLHDENPAGLKPILAEQGPIKATIGKVSIFPASESGGSDVVKLDVTSPDLEALNKKVAELPHTDTHPTYQPHLTLGYVKAGEGQKYVGKEVPGLTGKEITFNDLTFSGQDESKTVIPLKKPVTPQIPNEPGTKYVVPGFATAGAEKTPSSEKYPNLDTFIKAYEKNLQQVVEKNPGEYSWPISKVPAVAGRMRKAILGGSYSHQGKAFVATAKELGIKPTRKAIEEYLSKDPEKATEETPAKPVDALGSTILFNEAQRVHNIIGDVRRAFQGTPENTKIETDRLEKQLVSSREYLEKIPEAGESQRRGLENAIKEAEVLIKKSATHQQWHKDVAESEAEVEKSRTAKESKESFAAGDKVSVDRPDGTTATGTVKGISNQGVHVDIEGGGKRIAHPSRVHPLAQPEEKPKMEAGNEPAAPVESVRPAGNEPLEEQLPAAGESPGGGGTVAGSGGESRAVRKPRKRAGARQGPELEPSGGVVSGVVGDPTEPERTFPPRAEAVSSANHEHDYRIPDGRVVSGSPEARAKTNIEAIKTLRQIQTENRPATVQEQDILAKYVGWGAVPQLFAGKPEFQELQTELKSLLSEEEYSDAQRSTTNAHYTGDNVVDAMWKAVQHLGAKPGMSWLEPAVGVGNFFGRQPSTLLQGARRVGLDKDSISGQIAKLLYPDSGIDVVAFEDAELPKDYFDGAISNVPFGNFGVHDPEFRGKGFLTGSIHNYFFAKSLTHVRPGGVVAFVTSRYTMDAYEKPAVQFRNWVSSQADFIGAVRLPAGAFRQSSGTEVITDIIFLRRRAHGQVPTGDQWETSDRKMFKTNDYPYNVPHSVNQYYHTHPEMILGKENLSRGQFSSTDYNVEGKLTQEDLDKALLKLPSNLGFQDRAAGEKRSRRVATRELNAPAEQSKLGGLFFNDKGDLYRKTSKGSAEPVDVGAPAKKRIKGQLAIRDALVRLTTAELAGKSDNELDVLRRALNLSYDHFVKANGPLSSQANTASMKGDPDAPLLVSLERRFDKGNKAQGREPSAEKAPIFSRRMLKPAEVATSVGDPKEALYISLNEKGRIDWDRIGELTGRTPEQLQQDLAGLVYQDPQTEIWQTAEEYLSGSVRNKLKQARAIAKVDPRYKANADALEKVQPEDIAPGDIRALLGVTWVPIDRYSEFAAETLGAEHPEKFKVKYVGGNWIVDLGWGNRLNNGPKWSTARAGAVEILTDSLNMRRTKILDRASDGSTSVNPDETKSARAKQMEMQEHFEKWLFEDPKRADEVARIYNDTQNDLRLRTFDGGHLTLPGMTKDAAVVRGGDLDPHQKAAVWRQIVQPNVLLAHAVGSGKTFEMIAAGMELKRLGLVSRPMYVVPNATLTGWQTQFAALYPNKRIIVFSEKDLEKSKRQQIMAQIATGDWDAVVVPHSSFQFLPTGDEVFDQHFEKLSKDLQEAIDESQAAGLDTRQIKRMEKSKERLLTSLKDKRAADKKDQTVTWEQLGIDQLFVDESHEYKKLGFSTKQGNVAGIDQQGNQKTFDLLMKMRHTQDHGRGVVFATGTPVTNTMGELYTVMKYLIEKELDARGIGKFDEWAANFGRTVDVFEPKVEGGGYQMKARFAQFVNIPELAQLFRSFADVVTSDMIDIPRPEIVGGKRQAIETQLTDEQEDFLQELRQRAKSIRDDPRGSLPDNMLAVYGDAAKMAMDVRMVRPGAPDDPNGRLNVAADKIHQLWEESTPVKGTQLVMSDLGKPAEAGGSKDFSAYDELIRKLVERGIPRNEIAHIYQAKNKSQRARMFQDVNDGKIRVLLGSTMKMGVGVNVQQRLFAMHHLDVPHRPSDLEQREGRILRQGNENPNVHIYYYVTKGSLDEAKFSNVVRKAKFINQVMQGKSTVREAEDVGGMIPSLEMFQAMASGDPRVMQKMETDAEVDRLSGVFSGWKNQQYKIRGELSQIPQRIQWARNSIENIKQDIAIRDKGGDAWTVGKQKFSGEKIGKEVSEAIRKEVNKAISKKATDVEVGTAFGLPILVSAPHEGLVKVELGNTSSFVMNQDEVESADLYRRIRNQADALEEQIASKENIIEKAKKEQKNLESSIEDKWPYAEKLKELVEKQQALVKDLGADKGDDAAMAAGEGAEISDKSVEAQEVDEPEEEGGEEDEEEVPIGQRPEKAGERGVAPLDFLSLGVSKLVEKDILPTLANAAKGIAHAKNDIQRVMAPASREGAKETALTVREHAAELARATDRAEAALNTARKFFETEPAQSNLDFIDRIENGQPQANGAYQAIAGTMRQILDDRRQRVQDLGTGKLEEYYEDYFPHIWKDPAKATDVFKAWFGKRPMEGSKSFLKKRTIPTIKDGIDMGLEPESTNPVDLVLAKVREMDKYIFAHRALNELKDEGVLKFVRAGSAAPEGYAKINDNIAVVYGARTEEGAQTIRGQYYAPEPAATVLNNYLSPGLRKYGSFRVYMGLANILNQFQLGWSAYHLGFTTMEAAVSRAALGIMQMGRGDVLKGLGTVASSPIAPFRGLWEGDKVLKEWFNPGSQGQELGMIVDAMMMAGGRARMDKFYQTTVTKKMMEAFRQGNIWGGALRAPFALTEQVSRPVLEWAVPRQKMAVFADLARLEMEKVGTADPKKLREAMARAWDSVDNRMGQLVYDNLFWNKAVKDLAMASVRSVGWNMGTIREILGGGADTVKALGDGLRGKPPEITPRMAYIMALPMLAGLLGGVIYYLSTGQHPQELKDYFFPRRGPEGTPEWKKRMALPTYVKDVVHYGHDPYGTIKGKLHPLLETILEMLSNEDYFGHPIMHHKDPLVKQMEDMAKHVGTTFVPIAARPLLAPDKKAKDETTAEKILPFVGVTEAPKYITNEK